MQVENETAGEYCLLGHDTVHNWYQNQVGRGALKPDRRQQELVDRLQCLSDELAKARKADNESILLSWFNSAAETPRCLYIHGSVGRGKSYLMDGFFLNLPRTDKLRVHFHDFMRHFHADMKRHEGEDDPLRLVAENLAKKNSLLCFDEFHVSDIADALVLGRLLEILLKHGVVIVATSNYKPVDLYPNGLARDRFLPAIKMIGDRFDLFSLDGDIDYRLRVLEQAEMFLSPVNEENLAAMQKKFNELALGMTLKQSVKVSGRRMPAVARTSDAVWLEFDEVCCGNYGQNDYLQIASRFATVFLSGVPRLGAAERAEETRRFTWLVDILYDAKIKLAIMAEQALDYIYEGEGGESGRTISRLQEMQSRDYLALDARPPAII